MQGLGVGADTGVTQSFCWLYYLCRGLGTGLGLAGAELMTQRPGQAADSLGFGSWVTFFLPGRPSDLGGSI